MPYAIRNTLLLTLSEGGGGKRGFSYQPRISAAWYTAGQSEHNEKVRTANTVHIQDAVRTVTNSTVRTVRTNTNREHGNMHRKEGTWEPMHAHSTHLHSGQRNRTHTQTKE
jgi:hypothetical protein